DEEHRFGVAHKERLKQLRHSVDVLTMSATPIPRTLYLALSGARDMSLITTPPLNRHPIKTEVGPYDGEVIKTAILHELERDGQVFLLHNRVDSIYAMAEEVGKLVPQARVAVAHGQMPEGALEDVMFAFLNREYDVLVTTTIIESGLDIPNANTIVVDHADKLGLAQLYQIRGRVGRSDRKAYCYCLYPRGKQLTEDARDRLAAISQYTALGSGYQIALRDLEIRGVGNILGEEQHGHMLAVGYDVYMQLLEETIGELSGGEEAVPMALVDLSVAAFVPDEWGKMEHYKRLASVMSVKELDFIEEEWQDRYGKLPPSVKNLLRVVRIKLRATELGIRTIRSDAHSIRVEGGVDRKSWATIQLKQPGLARWQWGKDELQAPRSGGSEQQLDAIERLLTAIEAQAPALTVG
ncbi:MAG: TRCF domain-containing protein, partial [Bacteroidota bacterium]